MFLEIDVYFLSCLDILNYILQWIEEHSVLMGVIVPVSAGYLCFSSYLKKKRAEAYFGFYKRLNMQLKNLYALLNDNKWLEINKANHGNIYSLLYDNDTRESVCTAFHCPDSDDIETLKSLASQIKITITESECNVNPEGCIKKNWDSYLQTIYDFCEFIIQNNLHGKRNISKIDGNFIHIVKCKELVTAINETTKHLDKELNRN